MRYPLNRWKTNGPIHIVTKMIAPQNDAGLAVVLYTGCDCTYDMCAAERDRDFDKWKWFSLLLDEATH